MGIHIGIAGNIGAGKTTLLHALGSELGARVYEEHVEDNPYLAHFYRDPARFAFASAVHFATEACHDQKEIRQGTSLGIQERTVYEQRDVFIRMRKDEGIYTPDEAATLESLINLGVGALELPEVMIYLETTPEQCMWQIQARGHDYETPDLLPLQTLAMFDQYYRDWLSHPELADRLLIVRNCDVRDRETIYDIADRVIQKLGGYEGLSYEGR